MLSCIEQSSFPHPLRSEAFPQQSTRMLVAALAVLVAEVGTRPRAAAPRATMPVPHREALRSVLPTTRTLPTAPL
jgi:hypothetical protein